MTLKERRFVELFTGRCAGNATAAAVDAGYTKNRRAAAVRAWKLLRKGNVQAAIKARIQKREERAELDDAEVDRTLAVIVRDGSEDTFARLRAMDIVNKVRGRYTLKFVGRLTIEEALGQANDELAKKAGR